MLCDKKKFCYSPILKKSQATLIHSVLFTALQFMHKQNKDQEAMNLEVPDLDAAKEARLYVVLLGNR